MARKRGEANALFLDAAYATEAVIGPTREGLGAKLGALLFQFSPDEFGPPQLFAERLHAFLAALPKAATYAVELRNPELLTPAYAAALAQGGAVHCHNAWGEMPSVLEQARAVPPIARRPLIVRWLFPPGDSYAAASERLAPFDRIVLDQNRMSAAPKGAPSDQRTPGRRCTTYSLRSSDSSTLSARCGTIGSPSGDQRNRLE